MYAQCPGLHLSAIGAGSRNILPFFMGGVFRVGKIGCVTLNSDGSVKRT